MPRVQWSPCPAVFPHILDLFIHDRAFAASVAAKTMEAIDKQLSNNTGPERKRGNGNSVAQVKRAAIKAKNRARNKVAHR